MVYYKCKKKFKNKNKNPTRIAQKHLLTTDFSPKFHREANDQKFSRKEGETENQLIKAIAVAVSNLVQWFMAHLLRSLPMSTVMPADAHAAANVRVDVIPSPMVKKLTTLQFRKLRHFDLSYCVDTRRRSLSLPSMAEPQSDKTPTLSEQYHLKEKEKPDVGTKSVEVKEVEKPVNAASDEVVSEKAEGSPAAAEESTEVTPVVTEESSEVNPAVGKSTEANSAAVENNTETETAPAATEASSENSEEENAGEQEAVEETTEIKLETAPADFRFPTTNQTRHCFTRYIEYHRCIAAKGEGAPECDKFSKYYRALCPGEWVDRWNEQRENGTFPGPL